MKTSVDIPDFVLGQAKSAATREGISLRQFVIEAVKEKLRRSLIRAEKPWMKHFGKLKKLRRETKQLEKRIEDAFEHVGREA